MTGLTNSARLGVNVQYRVREVKRFIVTRYEWHEVHGDGGTGSGPSGSQQLTGEYPNWDTAYAVGHALCKAEHERLGYPIDDMRIQYPVPVQNGEVLTLCEEFHSEEERAERGRIIVNSEGEIEDVG